MLQMWLPLVRVDFDIETNRLIGFVLPCNSNGLPIVDSFLALSFGDIEECFKSQQIAKFAYVFMAQCVCGMSLHFVLAVLVPTIALQQQRY